MSGIHAERWDSGLPEGPTRSDERAFRIESEHAGFGRDAAVGAGGQFLREGGARPERVQGEGVSNVGQTDGARPAPHVLMRPRTAASSEGMTRGMAAALRLVLVMALA